MESILIQKTEQNIFNLYDKFIDEKSELESTLATIELLSDKSAIRDIEKGLSEIKDKKYKTMTFDEIDNL